MFSLAVKNSVLVILIIFIIHFMIKNILRERERSIMVHLPVRNQKLAMVEAEEAITHDTINKHEQLTQHAPMIVEAEEDSAKKEVLNKPTQDCNVNIVMVQQTHEPTKVDDDLDKWFNQSSTVDIGKQSNVPKVEASKQQLYEEQHEIANLIVNKYDKENCMNGGKVYGDLTGFDSQFMAYSEL